MISLETYGPPPFLSPEEGFGSLLGTLLRLTISTKEYLIHPYSVFGFYELQLVFLLEYPLLGGLFPNFVCSHFS